MTNVIESWARRRQLVMRLGLAFVLLFAGISILSNPSDWIGFVPEWMDNFIPRETFLQIHAYFEILLAVLTIFNKWPKILYAVTALDMLSILIFYGVDSVTFRDIGVLALAVGLWLDSFTPTTVSS